MKPSFTVRELDNKKLLLLFFNKITQTKPCIEMIQLLLYQINWPAILDLEGVGRDWTEFPYNPSAVSQEFLVFSSGFSCFNVK